MNGILSYTEDIRKFTSGQKYAGKNIQTKDNKTAYITKTGIAKPYTSVSQLSNVNGCTTGIERINAKWGDMGIPVGSLMVNGQSCGNETSYVQSMPPQPTFDWRFYIQSYPTLKLTTEQQAKDHWYSTGIYQGLLPNGSVLSSMTNLGKIGYIDINTTMHAVPQEAYKYNGIYKKFDGTNVTGASMQDCSRPIPSVKYGDQIYIKNGDKFGSMNSQYVLTFGNDQTKFFLRPPVGSDALTGTPLKYGDKVSIAMSSVNGMDDCGWWGCNVGYVNTTSSLFSFGSGREKGGQTFTIAVPSGTNFTNGTEVKFNSPFSLVATITTQPWTVLKGVNYPGNDIRYSIKSYADCKISCEQTPGCIGIATDLLGRGNCWLKNRFGNRRANWWVSTSVLSSNTTQNKTGYLQSNNTVLFDNLPPNTGNSIFTFQNILTSTYDTTCDLSALQRNCNSDTNCTGFIHSETENTWQKTTFNSSSQQYKITDKRPKIYIKEATVDMKDKSCLSGTSKFIDATMFDKYPDGNDFKMNSDQCRIDLSKIIEKQKIYNNNNTTYNSSSSAILQKYPNLPPYTDKLINTSNTMKTKTTEYSNIVDKINSGQNENRDTQVQQNEDLSLLESGNKTQTLLWGISSIVVISMVVIMRNKVKVIS
jgi:hypothetical protein